MKKEIASPFCRPKRGCSVCSCVNVVSKGQTNKQTTALDTLVTILQRDTHKNAAKTNLFRVRLSIQLMELLSS